MKQNNYMIKKEAVREIIKEANVLKNMLLTSIDDLSTNNTVDIKKKLKDLKDSKLKHFQQRINLK